MNSQQKRVLESPEQEDRTTKISRIGAIQAMAFTLPNNNSQGNASNSLTQSSDELLAVCQKNELIAAIKQSIAEEFEKHDKEKLDPLIRDVADIKVELVTFKQNRDNDQERIKSLERLLKQRNVIFSNLPHSNNPKEGVNDTCRNLLKLSGELFIDKATILKSNAASGKMTVLATFGSQSQVDSIFGNSRNLKDSGIGVARDLCLEDRGARDKLLRIRKMIKEKDSSVIVKVYGNEMILNKIKFTYNTNFFGNKKQKINGLEYIAQNFGIDCNEIFDNDKQI